MIRLIFESGGYGSFDEILRFALSFLEVDDDYESFNDSHLNLML